jgi:DNA helicase II / ATP-dependent DNA helicase PcrA
MVRRKGNNVMNFNKEQLDVINHKDGTCIVIAGAGSGKSTVSVHRVEKLIENGVEEKDILVSSFSNKSATDLKGKLKQLGIKNVKVGTFHSVCGNILFREGIDTKNKIKPYEANNSFGEINNKKVTTGETQDILSFIGYQKNNMITYKDDFIMNKDSKFTEQDLRNFFKSYEITKTKLKKYDWDDVLLKCYDVLKANPNKYTYKYIIIDESQDNSLIQNET